MTTQDKIIQRDSRYAVVRMLADSLLLMKASARPVDYLVNISALFHHDREIHHSVLSRIDFVEKRNQKVEA